MTMVVIGIEMGGESTRRRVEEVGGTKREGGNGGRWAESVDPLRRERVEAMAQL